MAMISSPVGAAEVAAAHDVLRDVLPPTPLLHSRVLSERLGGPVFLKCENLQRTGSFKARGGYYRISRLSEAERAGGWSRPAPATAPRGWRSRPRCSA